MSFILNKIILGSKRCFILYKFRELTNVHSQWGLNRWNEELEKVEKLLFEIDLDNYLDEIRKLRQQLMEVQKPSIISLSPEKNMQKKSNLNFLLKFF